MKKQKYIKQPKITKEAKHTHLPFSWWKFLIKLLVLFIAVVLVVSFTDKKGYFTADQRNNHIRRKWASFYDYTKTKEVDIIIIGNSHIITGIDPLVLSSATSSTCYILGNAGTGIIDAWFQLGEALKHTQPKLVIIETYCINNDEKPKKEPTPYLQSFDAQKGKLYKLQCMPHLFYSDSWTAAWSPSIRNHTFLLTDTARIKYNIKNPKEPTLKKLDLGRFARFGYGLQDSTLLKYDSIGAPVNGEEYQMSAFTKKYLQKIMQMCEEKQIPVLFFTVPMYYKHVSNYDVWRITLNEELQKYPNAKWFDLQMDYDTLLYTPNMFEDTYEKNQHLSDLGMVVTAYKIAEFIYQHYSDLLPDRSKDQKWIDDFKTTDGFAYNQDIVEGMADFSSIVKDKQVGIFHIREMALQKNTENNRLILKIDKQENLPSVLTVQLNITLQNRNLIVPIQVFRMKSVFPPKYEVYLSDIKKEVIINELLNITN